MIGFLNVIKPSGITSHDLVYKIRKLSGIKQVGHGGTLDPLAQGVMVVGLGKACRLLQYLPDDKCYRAEILLGRRTDTDDTEGSILEEKELDASITEALIKEKLAGFVGKLIQIPPVYSAIKQGGRKLYEMARKGEAPRELPGRPVEIHKLEVLAVELPVVVARIECSKGTYIRSIARDLGMQLGTGGCLQGLVREQSGNFKIEEAHSIEELTELRAEQSLSNCLVSPVEALGLDSFEVDEAMAKRIANGQRIALSDLDLDLNAAPEKRLFACYRANPIALMKLTEDSLLRPEVVLDHAILSN